MESKNGAVLMAGTVAHVLEGPDPDGALLALTGVAVASVCLRPAGSARGWSDPVGRVLAAGRPVIALASRVPADGAADLRRREREEPRPICHREFPARFYCRVIGAGSTCPAEGQSLTWERAIGTGGWSGRRQRHSDPGARREAKRWIRLAGRTDKRVDGLDRQAGRRAGLVRPEAHGFSTQSSRATTCPAGKLRYQVPHSSRFRVRRKLLKSSRTMLG